MKSRRLDRNDEVKSQGFNLDDFGNNGSERDAQVSTFRHYLSVLLRGKWIILGCIALALAGAIAYTKLTTPIYETSAMVLVNPKGFSPLSQASSSGEMASNKITNELGILKSQTLAEAVAQTILQNPYADSGKTRLLPIASRAGGLAAEAQ